MVRQIETTAQAAQREITRLIEAGALDAPLLIDTGTGDIRRIFHETDPAWVIASIQKKVLNTSFLSANHATDST